MINLSFYAILFRFLTSVLPSTNSMFTQLKLELLHANSVLRCAHESAVYVYTPYITLYVFFQMSTKVCIISQAA